MNSVLLSAVTRRDRERILDRLAELRALDRLMRQPGTLATPPAGATTRRTAR